MEATQHLTFTASMAIASLVFISAYIIVFSEVFHRTTSALLGAVVMVAVGEYFGFYDQETALKAIDANTLILLASMMMLITMLKPTGGFEYIGIKIVRLAVGSSVKLMVYLSLTVSIISMFLDNVTTILIFAPLTVLITRLVHINPMPYLVAEAIMSNIGGIATLIGDPPNLMIGSAAKIGFTDFVWHMGPIVFLTWLSSILVLLFTFRKELRSQQFEELHLDQNNAINNPRHLFYVLFALAVVIVLFFIHHHLHLYPAFVALIGVVIAMPLIRPRPEALFGEVEWSVLFFFAGLFVIVGGLEASGLLHLIGLQLAELAKNPEDLLLTCIALMWGAALVSAIVDNIPFTVTMIPIILSLESYGVNILPLWWALALGSGLGGNGTHIGATANIICVAEAERSGIEAARITPLLWLKKALPTTFFSLIVSSIIFSLLINYMSVL
ncbi:ArsB/NhaD family transporter [Candidatus Venteria ishoeyi]|uniref:Inner membrane protein YbiR n=1 Tax=Candidatus Venteria ishoeyi TaxID=1899563 RepID=A0A1H6FDC6_9GAMM|nr:ArsB/NhaD family transporter [Candidatus Venteria ishoeyi]MDM8547850.1 ArsB/NhaD family transporter [Candidatus Venteria ishoeyi]SEH07653.1 Inner membrane protein YbiR [Candidatus Venteria ishoeyi]